jgi:hypothetical protein
MCDQLPRSSRDESQIRLRRVLGLAGGLVLPLCDGFGEFMATCTGLTRGLPLHRAPTPEPLDVAVGGVFTDTALSRVEDSGP